MPTKQSAARRRTATESECVACNRMLPLVEFGPRRARCRECRRDQARERAARQRKSCPSCLEPIDKRSNLCPRCFQTGPRKTQYARSVTGQGYVILGGHHDHPNARKAKNSGRIFEHVLVMSQILGRPLRPGENVHHKNGVRADNRPENLELWVVSQPAGQRPADLVVWAYEILDRYAEMAA